MYSGRENRNFNPCHKAIDNHKAWCVSFQDIISHIRACSHSAAYACSMSPPVVQQIYTSMKVILGEDGSNKGQILSVHKG